MAFSLYAALDSSDDDEEHESLISIGPAAPQARSRQQSSGSRSRSSTGPAVPQELLRQPSRTSRESLENSPLWSGARGLLGQSCREKVVFPDAAKIERLTNALPTEPFRWPHKFVRALSATDLGPDGPDLCVPSGATASFYSEFSGSGAAEAALMAIVNASGRQLHVSQSHAADIDAGCRSVLHTACAGLSQFA